MLELWDSIVCLVRWLAATIKNGSIEAVEFVLTALIAVVNAFLFLLPEAAMDKPVVDGTWLGVINWAFPLAPLIGLLGTLVAVTIVYKALRWATKHAT